MELVDIEIYEIGSSNNSIGSVVDRGTMNADAIPRIHELVYSPPFDDKGVYMVVLVGHVLYEGIHRPRLYVKRMDGDILEELIKNYVN